MCFRIPWHPSQVAAMRVRCIGKSLVRERTCSRDVLERGICSPSSFSASENFLSVYLGQGVKLWHLQQGNVKDAASPTPTVFLHDSQRARGGKSRVFWSVLGDRPVLGTEGIGIGSGSVKGDVLCQQAVEITPGSPWLPSTEIVSAVPRLSTSAR